MSEPDEESEVDGLVADRDALLGDWPPSATRKGLYPNLQLCSRVRTYRFAGVPTMQPNWAGVVLGLVIAAVAGGISMATYEAASSAGGTYVVFYGAVSAGLWMAANSLFRRGY